MFCVVDVDRDVNNSPYAEHPSLKHGAGPFCYTPTLNLHGSNCNRIRLTCIISHTGIVVGTNTPRSSSSTSEVLNRIPYLSQRSKYSVEY